MTSEILTGDALEQLRTMESGTVNTCVTSPPYYGLRDYQTATWVGGDPDCKHIADKAKTKTFGNAEFNENRPSREETKTKGYYFDTVCAHCGAVKQDNQIGLEETPEAYISKLVAVFREVKRALRDDGTLWVNIGDSYATGTTANRQQSTNPGVGANNVEAQNSVPRIGTPGGCKTKDLIGIPWMLAFALRSDGWYLRQDIIWAKPNPMPESVTDRCTKSHEYIFLLSKSQRYYYNADAIKELSATDPHIPGNIKVDDSRNDADQMGKIWGEDGMRNKRDVWTVSTMPYKEAHFATFPQALIEPCILAGAPFGGLVLDPFTGSGTTGVTALQNGRNFIGVELNPKYVKMAIKRIRRDGQYQERIKEMAI